jgi:hypothetical protein
MGEMINEYKTSVGKPEMERSFGRPKHRWEIKMENILGKYGGKLWTGLIWLKIWTSGQLL